MDLNDASYLDMKALGLHELVTGTRCTLDHLFILSRILLAPLVIFERVFDHRHSNDK